MLVATYIAAPCRRPTSRMNLLRVSPFAAALLALAACQNQKPQPTAASVAVFPVLLGGTASDEAANVVGMLLERGGMPAVELAPDPFRPDAADAFPAQAAAFARFVHDRCLPTDRALFVAIGGTRERGIDAIAAVLTDRTGKVLWQERHAAGEAVFDRERPREPLAACTFVVQRLRAPLGLGDPTRGDAPEGALAARTRQLAGAPDAQERAAIAARLAAARNGRSALDLVVVPVHGGGDRWSAPDAETVAGQLRAAGLRATATASPLPFHATASSNEQVVLWSSARSLQRALRELPAGTAHVLAIDVLFQDAQRVGAVHAWLLAPDGELVWVDHANSHHADFRERALATTSDAARLAAARAATALGAR
jgi:hypothetical protein